MDYSKLGQAAAESEDMTQNKSFERELPRQGPALLRLRDYIETGRHASNNPAYKPSLKAILIFELSHIDHLIEIDGKKVPSTIQVRLNKGATSKSGFKKLFNVMNAACGGGKKHFVQMIGQAFVGEIYHNSVGEGDKKQTYANLDLDGAWSFKPPVQVDVLSGTSVPIPVAELDGKPKVFLWGNESISEEDTVAMWDSIYIEGEREVEDPKTKEKSMISKNWIQETVMKNLEWEGSVTQALTQEHIILEEHEADPTNVAIVPEATTAEAPKASIDAQSALAKAASAAPVGQPSLDD